MPRRLRKPAPLTPQQAAQKRLARAASLLAAGTRCGYRCEIVAAAHIGPLREAVRGFLRRAAAAPELPRTHFHGKSFGQ